MSDFNGRPRRERPKTGRTFYSQAKLDQKLQINELVAKLTEQVETLRVRVEVLESGLNPQHQNHHQQPNNHHSSSHKLARAQQGGDNNPSYDVTNSIGGDSNNGAADIDNKRLSARVLKRKERGARKRLNQNHASQRASSRSDPINGSPARGDQQQQQNNNLASKPSSGTTQRPQPLNQQGDLESNRCENNEVRSNTQQDRPRDSERYPSKHKPRKFFQKNGKLQTGQQQQPRLTNNQYPADDSTTQANEPSSEERVDGDDHQSNDRRVYRKKRPTYFRRGNKRGVRRVDSSERNSNDTSPQNEANGYESNNRINSATDGNKSNNKQNFPQLSEDKMNEVIQTLKRQFDGADRKAVRNTINSKGPKVAYEFAVHILDYAICDETSPSMLKETANNLFYLISSDGDTHHDVDFQNAFYKALANISEREHEIAIDAPRFMDTLGQLLADSIVLLLDNPKQKANVKKFIERSVNSYNDTNRATFLASIMKGLENSKDESFAKGVWGQGQLSWDEYKIEGKLDDFLDQHGVKFTTAQ